VQLAGSFPVPPLDLVVPARPARASTAPPEVEGRGGRPKDLRAGSTTLTRKDRHGPA
jgi:hypothetical protein